MNKNNLYNLDIKHKNILILNNDYILTDFGTVL